MDKYIKPINIGNVQLANNVFLAPMAGITDDAFRVLCKEEGAGLVYSEMVSVKGLHYESRKTRELLEISEETKPVAVQIFGSEPEIIHNICASLKSTDAAIIDINMGCPAPKIVKNGEGSALTKDPEKVSAVIKAAVKGVDGQKPVTVKFRRGFYSGVENAVEIAAIAQESGAAAVCVHGRFRDQFYSGESDLEIISKVKQAVTIPVIGNGDVIDRASAVRMFEVTGCDAVMVGRGAQGDPWIFSRILNEGITKRPGKEGIIGTIIRHLEMLIVLKGERTAVNEMRKHIGWYIKGMENAAGMRNSIFQINSKDELIEYLLKI